MVNIITLRVITIVLEEPDPSLESFNIENFLDLQGVVF